MKKNEINEQVNTTNDKRKIVAWYNHGMPDYDNIFLKPLREKYNVLTGGHSEKSEFNIYGGRYFEQARIDSLELIASNLKRGLSIEESYVNWPDTETPYAVITGDEELLKHYKWQGLAAFRRGREEERLVEYVKMVLG